MLRTSIKSKLPSMAFGRARQALPARRVLSTLGNPMFPQRPLPELETFEESIENSKKAKQANGGDPEKKGFVDILADHGGKIALVVFGGVIALFYTYYASGKDRNKLEDGISEAALIEPYEIQELRFTNKLSKDDFVAIADQCRTHFHSGQATYAEFVLFLRDKVVLPALPVDTSSSTSHYNSFDAYGGNNKTTGAPQAAAAPRRVQLNSAHLLDRVIMGHIQRKFAPSTPASTTEASASSSSSGSDFVHAAQSGVTESHINGVPTKTVSWTSTPLDVDLLLVILNLAMVPQAEARVQALYELAKLYPESTSGEHAHSAAVSSSGSSGDSADSNAKDASGDTLSQDTVPRASLERVIRHLIETDQIPPAKQSIESGVKYPIKLHRRKNEADMVADYEVKKKLPNKVQNCDYDTFRAIVLSYQVCAWGECYTSNDR